MEMMVKIPRFIEKYRQKIMKLSLSNGIFSKLGIKENFSQIKQLGFKNIEFNMKSIRKERDTDVYREQKAS